MACKVENSCCGVTSGAACCGTKPCTTPCSNTTGGCCDLAKMKLKVVYFNAPARAELIRWMLHFRAAPFEDVRVKHEDWPAMKEKYPTKQLPVLEYTNPKTGKQCVVVQGPAIIRTIAGITKLDGKTPEDAIVADQVYECLRDVRELGYQMYSEKDETRKEELKNKLKTVVMPSMLCFIEKKIAENNGKFVTGTDYTYADIACAVLFDTLRSRAPEDLPQYEKNFPHLFQLAKKITETESIKKYLAARPAPEQF
jgi:glutathione S-transferase